MTRNVTFLAILLVACGEGSNNADPDGNGGNGGNGATPMTSGSAGDSGTMDGGQAGNGADGGSSGGGSDSGEVVRGAVSLHILSPDGCSLEEQFQDFPQVQSGHPVTATDKGEGIAHGEMTEDFPATVLCNWFTPDVSKGMDVVITLGPAGQRRAVNLGGKMIVGEPMEGGMVLNSADLPDQYGGTCTCTAIEIDEATRSVWGEVQCDEFNTFDDSDHCAVGPSYFFFENCTLP